MELFKKHPYIAGAVALLGGLFVFLAIRSRSNAPHSSLSDISTDLSNAQTAMNISAQQNGAQLAVAQISGQIAAYQANAELQAVQAKTAGDVAIATAQASRDLGIATVSADAAIQQTKIVSDTKAAIASDYFHTSLDAINSQIDFQKIAEQHAYEISSAVVAGASRDKSRSSTGWAQIISALTGRGPEAIAANQPSAVADSPSSIIGSVGKAITGLFGG